MHNVQSDSMLGAIAIMLFEHLSSKETIGERINAHYESRPGCVKLIAWTYSILIHSTTCHSA